MTTLQNLIDNALDNTYFDSLKRYASFCKEYLEYILTGLQAEFESTPETNYAFFQYKDCSAISRPINKNLFYRAPEIDQRQKEFFDILKNIRDIKNNFELRAVLNRYVYTCQIAIGATLDASGNPNAARKIVGQTFENFIRLLITEIGIDVKTGTTTQTVQDESVCDAKYRSQHDLLIYEQDTLKAIGSVKTSSKDRMERIFFDRSIYNRLAPSYIPHFAIFLNDIQRGAKTTESSIPKYRVNSTFVKDHFKVYTVLLNPLNGVYYCDLRPNMAEDPLLQQNIRTLDYLLVEDVWEF